MPIYLGRHVGVPDGSPPHWEAPLSGVGEGLLSHIQLQTLSEMATPVAIGDAPGWGIMVYDTPVAHRSLILLGDSAGERLSVSAKATLETVLELGESIAAATLGRAIAEILTAHASPDGMGRWMTLSPQSDFRLRLRLGAAVVEYQMPHGGAAWNNFRDRLRLEYSRNRTEALAGLVTPDLHRKRLDVWQRRYGVDYREFLGTEPDEGTVRPTTSISDDFEVDSSADWTADSGTFTVDSADNGYLEPATAELVVRHNTGLSDDTHDVLATVDTGGTSWFGPMGRKAASSTLTYVAVLQQGGAAEVVVFSRTAGSYSQVGAVEADTFSAGNIYEIRITDSDTVQIWVNGSQVGADRTTTVGGGNTSVGLVGSSTNHDFEAFSADDFAAGGAPRRIFTIS